MLDYSILPLPTEGHGSHAYWIQQIKAAEEKRAIYKTEWDRNIQSYLARSLDTIPTTDTVVVPKDFANVERKKAELFFQLPEVHLIPKLPGLEDAVLTFQAVINYYLNPCGVDAAALMSELLFDALCPAGLMCSKIGYESFTDGTKQVQVGQREIQPAQPNVGAILGLGATVPAHTEPVMQSVPNIIYERYFWNRISPAKILIPPDFDGSNYDKAPWLGFEFEDDWEVMARQYQLDVDQSHGGAVEEDKLKSDRQFPAGRGQPKRAKGWELWYRAALYDPTIKHPEKFRRLVIIDGVKDPVRHEDSPYLKLRGNPIHIGALRYVSDTAYPPSEVSIGTAQVRELNKSRTQMLLQRERNVPMRMGDVSRLGGLEALQKVERNVYQAIIPVQGLDANNPPIIEISRANFPPENFGFDKVIERDLNEIWAFGANQRGDENESRRTATEVRNIQSNVTIRMDFERKQAIRFFMGGVEKLGALIQQFADQEAYVQIVGQDGVAKLQAWNKDTIDGEYLYDAKPDSSIRVDAAEDFQDLLALYNLWAKDPHSNRIELMIRMARLKNLNPERVIIPQLPPKGPEPPAVGFSFKGDDLDPRNPAFPLVIEVMTQGGYQLSPEAITQAMTHAETAGQIMGTVAQPSGVVHSGQQLLHGGAAPTADRITKHMGQGEGMHNPTGELTGPPTRP